MSEESSGWWTDGHQIALVAKLWQTCVIHARRETHVRVLDSSIELRLRLREHFVSLIFYVNFRFIIHYSSFLYEYGSYFTTWSFDSRIEKEID